MFFNSFVSRFAMLALALVVLAGCETAADREKLAQRANVSGWITTDPMFDEPPLAERGVRRIAVVYDWWAAISMVKVGWTIFDSERWERDASALLTRAAVEQQVVDRLAPTRIEAVNYGHMAEELKAVLAFNSWTGGYRIEEAGKPLLAELRAQDIDAILLLRDRALPDFVTDRTAELGAKGLFDNLEGIGAYAGFEVALIDTQTGREMENTRYVQATYEALPGAEWKGGFNSYSPAEQERIIAAVQKRIRVNVDEALRMLKAVP